MLERSLATVILASGVVLGCGGTSSETPPPLEPHPMNMHYSRSATTLGNEIELPVVADAGVNEPRDVPENEVDEVVPAAPRTWGSDKPLNK